MYLQYIIIKYIFMSMLLTVQDTLSNEQFCGKSGDRTFFTINAQYAVRVVDYSSFPSEEEWCAFLVFCVLFLCICVCVFLPLFDYLFFVDISVRAVLVLDLQVFGSGRVLQSQKCCRTCFFFASLN